MRQAAVLSLVPLLALAGTVTEVVSFDSRDLRLTRVNGYDLVQLADFPSTGEVGKPDLPEAVFNVLVPATASVTSIEAVRMEPEVIPGSFSIHPVQPPRPISSTSPPGFAGPDPAIYGSDSPYPEKTVEWVNTGTKSGFRVSGFAVHPLVYEPAHGRLTLYRRVELTIHYEEGQVRPTPLTKSQLGLFGADVAGLVINPEDVERFAPPEHVLDEPEVHYAIVTSTGLSTAFDNLAAWRTRKGYQTQVFTTDWINSNYPTGRDLAERIRMFIIDYFENRGLKFVLLGGDNHIVPGRRCRAVVGTTTGNVPADVYYADLQWSYDGNRNNIFGEMEDTVDLFYDVYVGRASVDDAAQATTFTNKVLGYEKNPTTDYLKKVLLPYVWLWSGYSGRICCESIAALSPAGWTDHYIADPTNTSPMRDAINAGYHFAHPTAHGDDVGLYDMSGNPIYSTSVASGQTNSTRPVIMNSIACIAGNFEYSDCLAEALMNNPNGGAVAVMMNSRYGYGTPPNLGPSERFDIKFYDFFFRFDSVEIGVTHARAKDFYTYSALSQGVWRWCYWALNLFGDPNMPMWKEPPTAMTMTQPDTIQTGAQQVNVTVTASGSPVAGALVCCYKSGETHATGYTNAQGLATLTINPLTPGRMSVTATAKNRYPLEDSIVVVMGTPQPYMSYLRHFVDDGNNNRLDPGETANLYATVKNIGNARATGVSSVLRTASNHITFADSTADYGTLNAGDTSRGDAYVLTASASTPPGSRVQFTLHITSPEGTWDPTFELVIGIPVMPGAIVLDHDTGYCKLTVTCLGSIGFTEPPSDLGSGFSYPKTSPSQLYFSSFMLGNSTSYVVDRFYGQPATNMNTDFRLVDSLRTVTPPLMAAEHFRAVMSDADHSSPKNLVITQNSHMAAEPGYDDFVVLTYDVRNDGANAVTGLYAGVIADFDVGSSPTSNQAVSNEAKRFSYMRQASSANPCVGIKILEPDTFANLTAVDHARYVYPESSMTDGQKYRILNGTISQRNSSRNYDWSVAVSVGPFDLNPGTSERVAFSIVGGTSAQEFETNADSAQSWYDQNSSVSEPSPERPRAVGGFSCVPNPFTKSIQVSYHVVAAGRVKIQVFDVSGREVAELVDGDAAPGRHETSWRPQNLASGVYLVKISGPEGILTQKVLLSR